MQEFLRVLTTSGVSVSARFLSALLLGQFYIKCLIMHYFLVLFTFAMQYISNIARVNLKKKVLLLPKMCKCVVCC